ncbi:MAG: ABC transporter ATP-binding protein [Ignavibacteriae bacterium]|nr:ABC transporter ATP-binding protein [Ignavibacteriota bacterium]
MSYSIEVTNLTKIYNTRVSNNQKIKALDNLTLSIEKGIIFGLLGPNGAGKTTLIKILLGIVFPTSGNAKILSKDINDFEVRKQVGYLPENHKFPNYLSGEDVIKYYAELNGYEVNKNKINEVLQKVNMAQWGKTKIKKYSKGMMQRLGLAQSIVHDPEIIFLDEPTDGVDPIGRKEIRDILVDLKKKGKTIFINSHLLSEVELVSDKVAMLNHGKLIKIGSVEELTTSKELYEIEIGETLPKLLIDELKKKFSFELNENIIQLELNDSADVNSFLDELRKSNITIKSFNQKKNSLEDTFIKSLNADKLKS